jgi:H+/Cl- antiporter ClcA
MIGVIFTLFRILEVLTLIPVWGMLAYFVNKYQPATPPEQILFLFVVALLASVWAFLTMIVFHRAGWMPLYVAVVDLCFFGVLVGAVVVLAPWVRDTNCISWNGFFFNDAGWSPGVLRTDKECAMLKASWGLGIADIILFFLTAVAAWVIWDRSGVVVVERTRRRRSRY